MKLSKLSLYTGGLSSLFHEHLLDDEGKLHNEVRVGLTDGGSESLTEFLSRGGTSDEVNLIFTSNNEVWSPVALITKVILRAVSLEEYTVRGAIEECGVDVYGRVTDLLNELASEAIDELKTEFLIDYEGDSEYTLDEEVEYAVNEMGREAL